MAARVRMVALLDVHARRQGGDAQTFVVVIVIGLFLGMSECTNRIIV